jgi:hypothetical protein
MLRALLVLTAGLGCLSLEDFAQPAIQSPDKKAEAVKSKDDAAKSKTKESDKPKATEPTAEPKDVPKAKIPLGKLLTPHGAIIVVVDELREALSLVPTKSVLLSPEKYQDFMEQIKALERQLQPERKIPSICKLNGKLDGNFLVFRAEYLFSTEAAKTTVPLGLQGGYLTDVAEIDGEMALLEDGKDDGWVVQVEKAQRHKLTLNFRVPVKKSSLGGTERGIELGLPGAPTTIITLDFPNQIKELRWNETLEKRRITGRWVISPDKGSKSLSLAWKEPLPLSGNAPQPKVEGKIKVDIDEKDVHITAELTLDDSQLRTKDWRLLLPPQADVEVKEKPRDLTFEWIKPDAKTPYYILRTSDVTAEKWKISVSVHTPRPNPGERVAIGPFHVLDAIVHEGEIAVTMKPDVSLGQRLVYTRFGRTNRKNGEPEFVFHYSVPKVTEKDLKSTLVKQAPLALEWRLEKNYLETQVEHTLKLRSTTQGWEIDAVTRIHANALFSAFNSVDLRLPNPNPRGVVVIGTVMRGLAFPGSLPWPGIWKTFGLPATANPDEFAVFDELDVPLKMAPIDATGKTRVFLERSPAPKKVMLVVKNKVRMGRAHQRIRIDLPRPVGTQDRGAKLSIQSDENIELLNGPEGAEEPVPDRHRFNLSWDQSPNSVELAWKPFHREVVAHSTIDITLHEHTAQVKQTMQFPQMLSPLGRKTRDAQIALKVPSGITRVTQLLEGKSVQHTPVLQTLWLPASAEADVTDLVLQYDLDITDRHSLNVLSIWPVQVSRANAKVRVWSSSGQTARLREELGNRGMWKERSIEKVEGMDQFPVLVLQTFGSDPRLSLQIENTAHTTPAAFLATRALIQVRMLDDGSQECRARYLIHEIHAPHADIELPRFRDSATVTLGKKALNLEIIDGTDKIRVKLHPELATSPAVLDIKYTIPADALEGNNFWRTTMCAPVFHSPTVIREMRWQLTTAKPMMAVSLGRNVQPFVQWSWQTWLPTPESSVTSADCDAWLTLKEATQPPAPVTFSFAHVTMQPETVYHLSREGWILVCSGILLVMTLGGFFSPLPRWLFWPLLWCLALALVTFGLLCPATVAPVAFGTLPGVVLFLVFIGGHWVHQHRSRRQLVFLPGYSRAKPGSTMIRANAAKRPREASTVDAPGSEAPPEGTSANAGSASS